MLCTCNIKNVLCSAEKSSVIWAEPHSRSSAEQFGRTERSVDHYFRVMSVSKRVTAGTHQLFCPIHLNWVTKIKINYMCRPVVSITFFLGFE